MMNEPYGESAGGISSVDSISSSLSGISYQDVSSACAYGASSHHHHQRRRTSEEKGAQQLRPSKPGPKAEKVGLRHEAVDGRRAAEEWMVDYALRKEVKRLARAQKRKVEMLVQAFESVLPTVAIASEKKLMETQDNLILRLDQLGVWERSCKW